MSKPDIEKLKKIYKQMSTPEERMLDVIEMAENGEFNGKDGRTPSTVELLSMIAPLIPPAIPGAPGSDGKSPSAKELQHIIVPLIPKPIAGKDGSPDTPFQIRDKIISLKGKERLSVLDLKDTEWLKSGKDRIQWTQAGFKLYTDNTLTGDGTQSNPLHSGGSSSPLTTKGDLYGFDTANNRIPVGANGTVLTADSTQSLGVKWGAAGGDTSIGGAVTSGTAGSVLFVNPSGILAQDNSNFFWDASNKRLGLGTTTPAYTLDVNGSTRIGTLNGLVKGTTGVLGVATAGTDYIAPYSGAGTGVIKYLVASSTAPAATKAIADYVCTGTADDVQIQAAINAAGTGTIKLTGGNFNVATAISLLSGINIIGDGRASTTITSAIASSPAYLAVLNVSNTSNILIQDVGFITNGVTPAITSLGHDGLTIINCKFTGATTNPAITLNGQNGTSTFNNTRIEKNEFTGMSSLQRTIYLYSCNGNTIKNTKIVNNTFNGQKGPCIYLDDYDVIDGTTILNNSFLDITDAGTVTTPAVAVFAGMAGLNLLIRNTVISNNYYKNTVTSNTEQGFVYFYSCKDTIISNNTMIGAWTPSTLTVGPCVAPGRTSTAVEGFVYTGNYIEGFDAAWDPDSMRYVEVANNIVVRCGGGFNIGYGIQEYVDIHDNVMYNCDVGTTYRTQTLFGNSNPVKCSFRNNTFVEDRPIQAPINVSASVISGGTLTASTAFYYKVTALDILGETVGSSEVTATTTGTNRQIRIQFNPVAGAISYKIYRSTTSGTYGATSLAGVNTNCDFFDGGVTLTTGTVPISSTVATSAVLYPMEFTGNYNFSDLVVTANRYYFPNGTYTSWYLKELGSEVLPTVFDGNEMHDSTGKTFDPSGIYALLTGRIGGQTLIGGTASGDNLTLKSTSNATKGKIVFGSLSAYDEVNDRFGFGTTSPNDKVQVVGNINTTTANSLIFGVGPGGATYKNVTIGYNSLLAQTTGDNNVAIGQGSLQLNQTGYQNIAVGYGALGATISGNQNTAVGGNQVLGKNTNNLNVAIGCGAMHENVTGDSNVSVGQSSLYNSTSYGNAALGDSSGYSITSGHGNTFIGRDAGNNASQKVDAVNSTAIGTTSYNTKDNQVVIGTSSILETLLYGKVGINITPTAYVHLPAGTATAGTAPLKLTSGTNLTTPEAGAVEFDGTHFYGTVGTTRYKLDQQLGLITTVSGLPSASTAGVGARGFVTDATTPTFGATVVGGGAVASPVYSDGTNWKVG